MSHKDGQNRTVLRLHPFFHGTSASAAVSQHLSHCATPDAMSGRGLHCFVNEDEESITQPTLTSVKIGFKQETNQT